ncbi:hypothetical protein [Pedobacter sp. Leaf250]|uniref:hypothetical protein n=1 Tax=Pedobacter sp. Leaf250 TaxID=2876559 RepID=UPI001E425BCE|nr:hypothetical protein [Pedobacter sp. Leaf250]
MKTSNKLLIALALLLIIGPILVIAINVKLNYVKSEGENTYLGTTIINDEAFDHPSVGRIAIPISTPFKGIQVDDAKRFSIQVYVKKDNRYGIKVQTFYKDMITSKVDQDGYLHISIKDPSGNIGVNKLIVVVYCPIVENIKIKNAYIAEIAAVADTLNVDVENSESLFFTGAFTVNDNISKVAKVLNPTDINNLNLSLKNVEFNGYSSLIKELNIKALKSTVNIGSDDKSRIASYQNFSIVAKDSSLVKMQNVNATKISGNFSDDTQLQIPASILKRIFAN